MMLLIKRQPPWQCRVQALTAWLLRIQPNPFQHHALRFPVTRRRSTPRPSALPNKRTHPAQELARIFALVTAQRADLIQQATSAFLTATAVACPGLFEHFFPTHCTHFQRHQPMVSFSLRQRILFTSSFDTRSVSFHLSQFAYSYWIIGSLISSRIGF